MKRLIRYSILILCALLCMQNASAQKRHENKIIGIQYIGPSDKRVRPLIIAQSKEGIDVFKKIVLGMDNLELVNLHVVSSSLLKKLIAAGEVYFSSSISTSGSPQADAVIVLTIVEGHESKEVRLKRADGEKMLEELERVCKGNLALRANIIFFKESVMSWGAKG